MKLLAGQAGRAVGEALHQLGRICMLLFVLVLLATGLLAFRLSQGPLEIPDLASWLATQASGRGIRVHMQAAELAWAGYHEGGGAPLYVRLGGISVRNAAGLELASIPQARLVVLPSVLFSRAAPVWVTATDARFTGSIVPVSMAAVFQLGRRYRITRADIAVTLGAGRLGSGQASVPITGGGFSLELAQGHIWLNQGVMHLTPSGQSAPLVGFAGSAVFGGQQWQGSLTVTADRVQAPDLAQYWPPPLLKQTRNWVTKNITQGAATQANFTFGLAAPGDLSRLALTSATGDFIGTGLTLSWINGARPITALNGQFTVQNIDTALVTASSARLGALALSDGKLIITGMNHRDQTGQLSLSVAGNVADAMGIIGAPPLNLLAQAPPQLRAASGTVSGRITADLPFKVRLRLADVALNVDLRVRDAVVPGLIAGLDIADGVGSVDATTQTLAVDAAARLAGEPAKLSVRASFEGDEFGHFNLSSAAGPQMLRHFGLDAATALTAPVTGKAPFTLAVTGPATGTEQARLTADLTMLALGAPRFGWAKPAGVPGHLALWATLNSDQFIRLDHLSVAAPGLQIAGDTRGRQLVLDAVRIGGSQASGSITAPVAADPVWRVALSGPVLDLRLLPRGAENSAQAAPQATAPAASAPPSGPAWQVRLDFAALNLAASPAPALAGLQFGGAGRGDTLLQANGAVQGLTLAIAPAGANRRGLTLASDDAGLLLRVLDEYNGLLGGTLSLTAQYGGGGPTDGVVKLEKFRLLNPPVFAKVLQGLTVYGVPEAAAKPGLYFDRAVLPFSLQDGVLHVKNARAFSASLGFTATGAVGLGNNNAKIDATIVPLYAFNSALGKIPIIGRLFSAEKGGGLFAARAKISGGLSDPKVSINPLSALTPGVFRDLFGLDGSAVK